MNNLSHQEVNHLWFEVLIRTKMEQEWTRIRAEPELDNSQLDKQIFLHPSHEPSNNY